ncbi:MAG: PPC domain-containing protein [Promethearchaeota archaeon]
MRKNGVIILLSLIIFPSLFLIYNTVNTTNLTNIKINDENHENYDYQNKVPLTSDDNYEDNDDISQAIQISKGYYSLVCQDDDYFKIWIENGEEVAVEIYFMNSIGDLGLELYNASWASIGWSDGTGDMESISWVSDYTGLFYVRIYKLGAINNYDLNIFPIGDMYEMNNDFWSAPELFKGYYRHLNKRTDDWYKFNCEWGQTYTVSLYFTHLYGDLDLEIYQETNPTVAYLRADGFSDEESITFSANYYGFYYIKVYGKTSSIVNDYEMKIGGPEIPIFYEDFEGPISPKWSGIGGNNYMHVTSKDHSPLDLPGSHSLWCGNESTGNYDKKVGGGSTTYKESAIITDLDLRDFAYIELSFEYNCSIGYGEQTNISIRALGSQYYLNPKYTNNQFELGGNSQSSTGWSNITFDLSFFCGFESVDIIFSFETRDTFDNIFYGGIKIDNIMLKGFKDNDIWINNLGINVGEEFYYYFPQVNQDLWSDIFGKEIFAYQNGNVKIEIFSINDYGPYWDVVARFWDPWDDFEELQGTDEIKYRVYKNPLNMKSNGGFFIPSGDIMTYLRRADNYDGEHWDSKYDIHHWYEPKWNEFSIEFCYDDFRVHLNYNANGVLNGMTIQKNYDNYERIFEMWRGEPYEENKNEKDNEERRAVPGYDPIIIISLVSIISIIMVRKIKKSKK